MQMIDDLDQARRLERDAERFETPCGDGTIVWHSWGSGSPILLLHGGSGSWNHWVRNIQALVARDRRVLIPDLPGFGDSARPPHGEDADAIPDSLEAGLQRLISDTCCEVVGFSFGSMVASFTAATYPRRVARLVLVGAPALGVPMQPLNLRAWSHLPPGPEQSARLRHNLAALMLAMPESINDFSLALHSENLVRDRLTKRRISKTDVMRRTLPKIQCPVFGIWGLLDTLYRGHTDEIGPALRAAPEFRQLALIAQAGHWVQFEQASAFNAVLESMLTAG